MTPIPGTDRARDAWSRSDTVICVALFCAFVGSRILWVVGNPASSQYWEEGYRWLAVREIAAHAPLPLLDWQADHYQGSSLVVIGLAIKDAPMEKILVRVRLNEEALAAMNETEIDAAMNGVVVPRHPHVLVGKLQIVNLVVTQAIVLGQNDLDRVASYLQLAAQAKNHIAQAAHFGDRRAF